MGKFDVVFYFLQTGFVLLDTKLEVYVSGWEEGWVTGKEGWVAEKEGWVAGKERWVAGKL
jgi:hypothetical protein